MSRDSRPFCVSLKTEDQSMAAMISSSCTPLPLQGSRSVMRFESENTRKRSMASYSAACIDLSDDNLCDEDAGSDDCTHFGDKKRRLTFEQVKTLEKSFEVGNKLEPERKMQLARTLGLQPRQIAVWFQNRRARWKTKQLEKDYDALKQDYSALKSNYDALAEENRKFKDEMQRLKRELAKKAENNCDARGSEFESPHKSAVLFNIPSSSPTELSSVKSELRIKDFQEAGCSSILSESSSVLNIDSPRTIDSPPSPQPPVDLIRTPLEDCHRFLLPKVEEKSELMHQQEEETCYNLFNGYDEQGPMQWDYWLE